MEQETTEVLLARIDERTRGMSEGFQDFKTHFDKRLTSFENRVDKHFVTYSEFTPVIKALDHKASHVVTDGIKGQVDNVRREIDILRKIIFSAVGFVLVGVGAAVLRLVLTQ